MIWNRPMRGIDFAIWMPIAVVLAFVLPFAAALLIVAATPAHGHEHSRPDLDGWFTGLKSGKGPCCGGPSVDAVVVQDPDWESRDGHYRVRLGEVWYDVPDDAVITEPNRYGRTLVWPITGWGGTTIRCFLPGPMT